MSSRSGWEKRLAGTQKVGNNRVTEQLCFPMKKKGKRKLSVGSGWLSVSLNPSSPSTVGGLAGHTVSSGSRHSSASRRPGVSTLPRAGNGGVHRGDVPNFWVLSKLKTNCLLCIRTLSPFVQTIV